MRSVLVTGATTAVGYALVGALARDGDVAHVICVGAEEDGAARLRLSSAKISYARADFTRSRDLRDLLFGRARELGVQTVVHMAFHRSAALRGRDVHRLNVEATRELLLLAERHPTITKLVYQSSSDVYHIESQAPVLMGEEHPLDLTATAPQRVRDRVEADVTVCTRMGLSRLCIQVLRCAEVLASGAGSQLYDYLGSRVAFRPLGFDPMVNLLTAEDAAGALHRATRVDANGIFNIPGYDTLPLSAVIRNWGRVGVAVPGPLLAPLYRARAGAFGMEFRYDMNHRRFHFSSVLDGSRARDVLGYEPKTPIAWPSAARP